MGDKVKSSGDKKHGYLAQLDGMRAVAVLLVVAFHAVPNFAWLQGWRGVTIFFVLSGYLITSLALTEEANHGRMSFRAFYIRRTFRIFPLYYLVLLLYCVLVLGFNLTPDKRAGMVKALPYYFTYLQEIGLYILGGSEKVPFGQSWSLGYEEKFYLLWPVIIFGFLAKRKDLRPYVAGAMILVFALCGIVALPKTAVGLFFPYYHILMGCLLALVKPQRSTPRRVPLTYPALLVVLLCQFALYRVADSARAEVLNDMAYTLGVAVLLAGILTEDTWVRSVLAWRPLVFIGKVSYGIYLIHVLCINASRMVVKNPYLVLTLSVVSSIAAAAVLYRTIESPLIAVGRRLSARIIDRRRDTSASKQEIQA